MRVFVVDQTEPEHIWAEVSVPQEIIDDFAGRGLPLENWDYVPRTGGSTAMTHDQLLDRPAGRRLLDMWRSGGEDVHEAAHWRWVDEYNRAEVQRLADAGCPEALAILAGPWDLKTADAFTSAHLCDIDVKAAHAMLALADS